MTYIATLKPEDGRITVLFPDFPGCGTVGNTLDEVLALAAEALGGHVESLRDIGEAIPEPRSLSSIRAEIKDLDITFVAIPLIEDRGTTRRVNVSLDPGLLDAIDGAAKSRGMTRSAFLASAARRELVGV
jgi:predicted RNase H-like HicB family nuclease